MEPPPRLASLRLATPRLVTSRLDAAPHPLLNLRRCKLLTEGSTPRRGRRVLPESREGNGNGARPPPPPDERPCIPAWLHCSNLMIAELDAQPEAPTASVFDGIDDPLQRVVEGLRRIEAAEAMDLWHEPMP